jgi:chitin disaccharide deacetylase
LRPERSLIVNADDLGLSQGVNAGILRAHAHGIVTSASLMVRQARAQEAVTLAAEYPALALGLHVDLGQWDYAGGEWVPAYMRCEQTDETAVNCECRSQLEVFRALAGREPTHLDSHQHVHHSEPTASVMGVLAAELGVPLRGRSIRYEGGFYGQTGHGEPLPEGVTAEHLALLIGELPLGWTELGCHPGLGPVAESSYGHERQLEVQALCDPGARAELQQAGVRLRSFADFNNPA